MKVKRIKIEVIDKRINRIYFASGEYNISYNEVLISLKELQKEDEEINKIIYQEDGTIDVCYIEN